MDGVKIGSADNTSPATALDWQARQFQFAGRGGKQTIRIVAEPTKRESNGRGMMLDDIVLVETLPANTGWEDGSIPLSALSVALNDSDGSETLTLAIEGLPVGAWLTDGTRRFTASEGNTMANITGWALGILSFVPPHDYNGTLTLKVVATASEQATGEQTSSAADLVVTVLAVNDAPLARNAGYTLEEGGSVRIDFSELIGDADGDMLTLSFNNPKKGALTKNADGSYTFVPKKGYVGTDFFTYTVSDGRLSTTAAVTLTSTGRRIEDDDDVRCHVGFARSDQFGASDSDTGRSACIVVNSILGERKAYAPTDVHDESRSAVIEQGRTDVPTVITKIDWNGVAPDLGKVKGNEWAQEYFGGKGKDQRSLAEITGLTVRLGK